MNKLKMDKFYVECLDVLRKIKCSIINLKEENEKLKEENEKLKKENVSLKEKYSDLDY